MRRKLTTLRAKQGHSHNGAPRQLIDEATYREHQNTANIFSNTGVLVHWDAQYSGWSNGSRPRDHAIFLRVVTPLERPGPG